MVDMSDLKESLKNVASYSNTSNNTSKNENSLINILNEKSFYEGMGIEYNDYTPTYCKAEPLKLDDLLPNTKPSSNKNKGKIPYNKQPLKNTPTSVKPQASYKFQKRRTDKRVSLNCTPLTTNTSTQEYIQRLKYVLGEGKKVLKKGQTVWGFLYSTLSKSCGIIFPYTPQISITHPVNYENTEIIHSNLAINHYKNTPPPTISLDAVFTADTRANALHMLSALWFLRAVTKCDFGERANADENTVAGMPPPVLYLNGYNSILDNIPVVVTSFNYSLPKDKDYVALGVNLDSETQAFHDTYLYSDVSNNNLYASFDGNMSGSEGMKYLNGVANSLKSLQESATIMETNRYNNYYFNNWLPTEISFHVDLKIQPNLLKYKKKFNLNWYKMGLDNLDDYKGDTPIIIPSKNGQTDVSGKDCDEKTVTYVNTEIKANMPEINSILDYDNIKIKTVSDLINENISELPTFKMSSDFTIKANNTDTSNNPINSITGTGLLKSATTVNKFLEKDVLKEAYNKTNLSTQGKVYKFDRSGWSW